MLKKTITYTDYEDKERSEEFHFNLTKAEIVEMEVSKSGGLSQHLTSIVKSNDQGQIMATFKEIVLKSYGQIEPGGNRFIKSTELSTAFSQTEAYSELIMELATDANAAADFVKGIMPKVPNPPPASKN